MPIMNLGDLKLKWALFCVNFKGKEKGGGENKKNLAFCFIYSITSKKPQFSQASLICSIVVFLSSPFSFSKLIIGKFSIFCLLNLKSLLLSLSLFLSFVSYS